MLYIDFIVDWNYLARTGNKYSANIYANCIVNSRFQSKSKGGNLSLQSTLYIYIGCIENKGKL